MKSNNYKIRTMKREELDITLDWAFHEGWNPGLYDRDSFYTVDPHGFFMGFVDNQPVASLSAVSYGDDFGFLGLYIVKPEYRGKGYGLQIWNRAIEYLGNRTIGLDGVLDQQENYKKSGFSTAYKNIRYGGKVSSEVKKSSISTVPLAQIPFDRLVSYDAQLFSVSRPRFLHSWITQPESLAVGVVEEGKMKGYGVVRKCRTGYKIGPLFADNEIIAEAIFNKLRIFVGPDVYVFLDVPEVNKTGLALAQKYHMEALFETARMYKGKPPEIDVNKIFGITTFELG